MSNFKVKNKKKEKTDFRDSTTLDKKHKEYSKMFHNQKINIDDKSEKIKLLNEQLFEINKLKETNQLTEKDIEIKANILNEIESLETDIKCVESGKEEINYYDKIGEIICDYYELRDENKNEFQESKNIIDWLSKKKNKNEEENNSRSKLLNKYCQRVEGVRTIKDDGTNRIKYCKECNIEKTLDFGESTFVCTICGDSEEIILDEDKQIKEYSPYQRKNHFKEWLNQFQAKESTEIPESIFVEIITEMNKNRIKDLKSLTRDNMKSILKKLGHNNLYEHIPFIINKLTGLDPPTISRNIEIKFIDMFSKIQEPWELYKPPGRKNFLSYSYVLHKFCQLLELDNLLNSFPLLKSIKNLKEQEDVWEKICKHLKWEFISSI
tara:strand:+ start:1303 stop:2442 length:1140 start_codon:yes stop_codon:yes gene_type:complete